MSKTLVYEEQLNYIVLGMHNGMEEHNNLVSLGGRSLSLNEEGVRSLMNIIRCAPNPLRKFLWVLYLPFLFLNICTLVIWKGIISEWIFFFPQTYKHNLSGSGLFCFFPSSFFFWEREGGEFIYWLCQSRRDYKMMESSFDPTFWGMLTQVNSEFKLWELYGIFPVLIVVGLNSA